MMKKSKKENKSCNSNSTTTSNDSNHRHHHWQLTNLTSAPLPSPEEQTMRPTFFFFFSPSRSTLFLSFLFLFSLVGMLKLTSHLDTDPCPATVSSSASPSSSATNNLGFTLTSSRSLTQQPQSRWEDEVEKKRKNPKDADYFWKQPEDMGFRPCLDFSEEYRKETEMIMEDRRKYLLVVVSGGLNQQRNQIVDAVVIARILGAALVVPILQVNIIWADQSEFSDIFDLENLKKVLAEHVRVVSSLPSTHVRARPVEARGMPLGASASWIRSNYLKKFKREGVVLLRGLDSRLSKDLSPDLQKLRCKVGFHALRFSKAIQELGENIATRMRRRGPYLALHLRLEKDVWVRTGCLPGLGQDYDAIVHEERKTRPDLLTAKTKMPYEKRKLAGLCPLTSAEVARLLKALGAPRKARIYWAGGEPFGGALALKPLQREFPYLYNKFDISFPGELEPFANRSSILAAIDFVVAEKSDVFMPSHGGNMGRAIRGHRAYGGHKKYINPNKRQVIPYLLNKTMSDLELERVVKELHGGSIGQPEIRMDGMVKDVIAFPIPECMCNHTSTTPMV